MKKHVSSRFRTLSLGFAALLCGAVLVTAGAASAQPGPSLPQASPNVEVKQRVGITDFTVKYASPGVKGRAVFGGLVPYGQLWRAGANESTILNASHDFRFGDVAVPAGSYTVFAVPGESEWTVVLNTNTSLWGTNGYEQAKDAARITVKPAALAESRERMTFLFSNTTESTTDLDLEWADVRVRVPLAVDTKALTLAGIDSEFGESWRPYFMSARWVLESGGDLEKALDLVNTSLALKATWSNNWVKAQILAKQGQKAAALDHAVKAKRLGDGDYIYENFYKTAVAKAEAEWKKK